MDSIPEAFEVMDTESPHIQNIGPFYRHLTDHESILGLLIEEKHCNRTGRLHGAMVSAISDIALGQNIGLALFNQGAFDEMKNEEQRRAPMVTVSLNTDFVGSAALGDWVEVHVDVQKTGRTMAFANAYLLCHGERIARTSGVYRLVAERTSKC